MSRSGRRNDAVHQYRGVRLARGKVLTAGHGAGTLVSVDGIPLPPTELAQSLSPEGYEWGVSGAGRGTQALAHALLAYEFGPAVADSQYQACARGLLAGLPSSGLAGTAWTLTSADLKAWLDGPQADVHG